MKNNNNFFNMDSDVHYCLAKFKIKIQFVYGETKKIKCIRG